MAGSGVSGLAVAVATAGGLLVYAGLRGQNPAESLREISTGKVSPLPDGGLRASTAAVGSVAAAGTVGAAGGSVAAAAQKYRADKYSQLRRTRPGWSDCSSFCDKILTDVGIQPPVKWAATSNFRSSSQWVRVELADTQPGDVAINSHHMVMITASGGSAAIGQQNPRTNVRTGTVRELMGADFYCLRHRTGPILKKGSR
jgi:cell wall-associated NlpC family hydrolase